MENAPVALFLYNRPKSTLQVILSLLSNKIINNTVCYIFIDGPKDEFDVIKQKEIYHILNLYRNFFLEMIIIHNEKNIGLGSSIINGINTVFSKYDKIIVLEDDIVVNEHFLDYNNDMLIKFYNSEVFHISSWTPVSFKGNTIYKTNLMNCWGWSTWKNKWIHFEKDPIKALEYLNKDKSLIYDFNFNNDLIGQLYANKNFQINSWAIFWHFSIFFNNGYCINPTKPLTSNVGLLEGTNYIRFDFTDKLFTNRVFDYNKFYCASNLNNYNRQLRLFYKFKNNIIFKIINKSINILWKM